MKNRFESGDIVYAKTSPSVKLIVRRYVDEVYYCREYNAPTSPEKFFYERDLMESSNPAEKRDF